MTTLAVQSPNRLKIIGFWILKAVLALLFISTALFKLSGQPMMIAEFNAIGLGQWFRYFTGLFEAAGAILLLIPAFAGFGAALLFAVSVGAFLSQLLVLHMDVIHTIVLALVLGAIAWTKRDQIFARLGTATR